MTTFRIRKLAELVDGWRRVSQVRAAVAELTEGVLKGKDAFLERRLPDELVRGRFPPGIESATVLVVRPQSRTPGHKHPNSVHHLSVIEGGGSFHIGSRSDFLQPFDPAFPDRSVYVIPEGVPHAFESGHEPLVILTFHTVPLAELVEVAAETEKPRDRAEKRTAPGRTRGKIGPGRRGDRDKGWRSKR